MLTLLIRPSHPSWGTAGTVPKGQQGREPSSSLESPTLWVRRWNIPSLNHYPVAFSTCSCSSQLSTLTQRLLTAFPQAQGLLQPSLAPASTSHNKSRCWLSLWAHPGWGYGSASHTGAEQQVRAAPPPITSQNPSWLFLSSSFRIFYFYALPVPVRLICSSRPFISISN